MLLNLSGDSLHTGDATWRRRFFSWLPPSHHFLGLLALVLACAPLGAIAGRPPLVVPTQPGTVLERLPRGYAGLMPTTTVSPRVPSLLQIQALLATAARSGDARLAARADALLSRLPPPDSNAVLRAKAFAAQHRHDFTAALRLLDTALAKDPDDNDGRLARAQIQLVQGRLDLARKDCGALTLGMQIDAGALCLIALTMRRGDEAQAARLVDRLIAQAGADPDLMRYLLATRGEIAARAGDTDADQWFQRSLASAPDDVRTLAAYARYLRARGRNREVLGMLASPPDTDGLQLQRALAAHAAGSADAQQLVASQGRRYALAHAVGTQPEMRDEAEYLLTLRGDATAALELALRNFRQQRDVEDVDILQRAALAAKRPDALAGLQEWARSQHLDLSKSGVARK